MGQKINLNGTWNYEPLARVTLKPGRIFDEDVTDLPPSGQMTLPNNWQLAGLDNFHGRVRFERTFDFAGLSDADASAWLCFRGVDYFAQVWLNDRHLGGHEGYFQPFEFDVTPVIRTGTNTLRVEVNCPLEEPGTVWPDFKIMLKGVISHWDCRPGSWDPETGQDENSGGIWHDVYLETRPKAYVGHVKVTTHLAPDNVPTEFEIFRSFDPASQPRQAMVTVNSILEGEPGTYTLTARIGDTAPVSRTVTLTHSGEAFPIIVMAKNPRLWWTWDQGEPHLEDCTITLSKDDSVLTEKTLQVGLREIQFDKATGQWTLNGRRFFVRGTSVVPTLWLGEYDHNMIQEDLRMLLDAGVNGVRVCVHVNRDEFYTACDQAGIIVWQDFALQWGYEATADILHDAVHQVKDMVRLLVNHPSVALWCTMNESGAYNSEIIAPMLAAAIAEEDTSRHIHLESEVGEHTYCGWYYGHYRDYAGLPATPVLTEFGAQALPDLDSVKAMFGEQWPPDWDLMGYHDFQYRETFGVAGIDMGSGWQEFVENSQQYQADLLKYSLENYRKHRYTHLGGMFQFMFMDCWPSVTWSVVGYNRVPKKGYYTLKECYQPVLIGIDQMAKVRSTILVGPPNLGSHAISRPVTPWAINDTPEMITGAAYDVCLSDGSQEYHFASAAPFDLPPDSFVSKLPPFFPALPDDAPTGDYELTITLKQGDRILSQNKYANWCVYRVE